MVFWGLVLLVMIFVGLYIFLIDRTIWNVVARQNDEKSLDSLNSQTAQLESTYMSMENSLDMNMAKSLGFNSAPDTKYINRTTLGRLPTSPIE